MWCYEIITRLCRAQGVEVRCDTVCPPPLRARPPTLSLVVIQKMDLARGTTLTGWMEVGAPEGETDNSIGQETTLQPVLLNKNNLIL
jgi:hypothetical protein